MSRSIVKIGSKGENVLYLQQSLTKLGISPGPIDGIFGTKTDVAVRSFQKSKGLVVDGIVGNISWAAIDKVLKDLKPPLPPKPTLTIKDYFHYSKNQKFTFECEYNKYSSFNVTISYLTEYSAQLRYSNCNAQTTRILTNKDGKLIITGIRYGSCYMEDLTNKNIDTSEILLKEPLIKGTAWTLPDKSKRYISNENVKVTTPLGEFIALEVTTDYKDSTLLSYYVKNIGMVKSVLMLKNIQISPLSFIINNESTSLSKIEFNTILTEDVEFYYPNVVDDCLNFITKKLVFYTNDNAMQKITTAYKLLPKGNIESVLSPNTKINYLYLGNGLVFVDFTKELVSEMDAGTGYELMILQSITNTLGRYYHVDQVYITIAGEPYTSGSIIMDEGDFFTVNLENCKELL